MNEELMIKEEALRRALEIMSLYNNYRLHERVDVTIETAKKIESYLRGDL